MSWILVAYRVNKRLERFHVARELIGFVGLVVSACRYFRLHGLRALRVSVDKNNFGRTFYKDKEAIILLRMDGFTTMCRTLAHELAHLRFTEHDKQHKRLERRILRYWRQK